MTSYVKISVVLCACVALVCGQYYNGLDYSNDFLATSFGAPTYNMLAAAARDPRANTGPVVFPPSPAGDPGQTSGVVVGASGFGFVPPGSQGHAAPKFFYRGFFLRRRPNCERSHDGAMRSRRAITSNIPTDFTSVLFGNRPTTCQICMFELITR